MDTQAAKPKKPRRRGPRRRGGGNLEDSHKSQPSVDNGGPSSSKNHCSNKNRAPRPSRGPPPPPQLRITCRNITNAEKYGSCDDIGPLLQIIISKSNDKLAVKMELDQDSLQTCLDEAAAVAAAREAFEKQQKEKEEGIGEDEDQENMVEATDTEMETVPESPPVAENERDDTEKTSTSNLGGSSNKILVRILYMIPPRKTRRRGEKPGCVYLVLSAPALPSPQTTRPIKDADSATGLASVPAPSTIDVSAELAKRRLMLSKALEALTTVAAEDAKAKQDFSGLDVLESASQKAWKRPPANAYDRLEGTIFTSAAYKEFFETKQKEEDARSARPRPAPGGSGMASSSSSTAMANLAGVAAVTEDGQAVSNLVQHLLLKKKEQSKNKQIARKAAAPKDAAKAKPTAVVPPPSAAKDIGAGAANKSKKRKKKVNQGKSVTSQQNAASAKAGP